MKETKRALRRHQFATKFKKRIVNWTNDCSAIDLTQKDFRLSILRGERNTFLRTTGNPCNCWGCSGDNKYVRERRQYIDYNI
jgi:hypothetical protein